MSTIYNPLSSLPEGLNSPADFSSSLTGLTAAEAPPSALSVAPAANTPSPSNLDSLGDVITGALPNISGSQSATSISPSTLFNLLDFNLSRGVAVILGLLLIGGGIIMFRPEVGDTVRDAATAAIA